MMITGYDKSSVFSRDKSIREVLWYFLYNGLTFLSLLCVDELVFKYLLLLERYKEKLLL